MQFIPSAYAQTASAAPEGGALMTLLPLIIMIGVFYFLVMRPQIKREQARQAMRQTLKRGDNILTTGGLIAQITKLENENYLMAKIASGTEVRVARASVEGLTEAKIPAALASKTAAKKTTKKPTRKKAAAKK